MGEKGGQLREKFDSFEVPPEAKGEIRKIIETRRTTSGKWNLVPYKEEDLNEALRILRKHDKRIYLQMAIKEEIKERIDRRRFPAQKSPDVTKWFAPRWEAVRSLFGKGKMNPKSKETKDLLDSIDPEWVNNCKGQL